MFYVFFKRVVYFKESLGHLSRFWKPNKRGWIEMRCNTYGVYAADQDLLGLVAWCCKLSKEISEKLGTIEMK